MPDDLLHVLTQFHREVVVPDVERIVEERGNKTDKRIDGMLTHFDGIYHRLDRLDTEYQAIVAGVRRLEQQMIALEKRLESLEKRLDSLDKNDARHELDEIKANVAELQKRIAELEATL